MKCQVIIGNSRNNYNNHLDILSITKKHSNYKFILPFSYGYESVYSEKVKEEAISSGAIINDQFISYEEYEDFLNTSDCLIINSYRQMAVGNILIAFQKGLKVYLNKKNVVYKALLNNNFIIGNIEKLDDDLRNNNIHLNKESIIHNINSYNLMCEKYSLTDFKSQLILNKI